MNYRPEIDGLRALAVVSVIAFHFDETLVPSGFLGVDIFFVISGYVITAALMQRPKADSLFHFLAAFYAKRIKRIVPALVFSTIFAALIMVLFQDNPDPSLKTGITAQFGVSNLYLLSKSWDYFGSSSAYNAFLHTWSLGVEEQFYFVFPLLVWVSFKLGSRRKPSLVNGGLAHDIDQNLIRNGSSVLFRILIVASLSFLALFVVLQLYLPTWAFYTMPARFWELSAGALAFLSRDLPLCQAARKYSGTSVLSLFLICAILFFASKEVVILSTIAVVALACISILQVNRHAAGVKILSHGLAVHIGKRSYSLYLFHWPVLVLAQITIGVSSYTTPLLLLGIYAISAFSYRFVESPLRHRNWSQSSALTVLYGTLVATICSCLLFALLNPLHGKFYLGNNPPMQQIGVETLTTPYRIADNQWKGDACILSNNNQVGKKIAVSDCTLGSFDTARKHILVVGNSFSASFVQAFDSLVVTENYAVTITSSWGASFVRELENYTPWNKANDYYWDHVVPELVSQLQPGDLMFLMNDMASFATELERATPAEMSRLQKLEHGLKRLSFELSAKGINVAVLHGLPLAREANCTPSQAYPQWYNASNLKRCNFLDKKTTILRRSALDRALKQLERDGHIRVVDLFELYCPADVCTYQSQSGEMLYRDIYSHPSVEAARLSRPAIHSIVAK